jgi:hypothetical protein
MPYTGCVKVGSPIATSLKIRRPDEKGRRRRKKLNKGQDNKTKASQLA